MSARRKPVETSATKVRKAGPRRVILREEQQREWLLTQLRALKLDKDNPYAVTIERHEATRTAEQNRLYWAIVGELCDATGQDKEAMHAWLKAAHLGSRTVEVDGMAVEFPIDSRGLTVKEFHSYVERVALWAAEKFGIVVL